MKILTKDERIRLVPVGTQRTSPLRKNAFSLEVGEALFVPKKEFKGYKYSPKTTIGSLLYHQNKKFSSRQHELDKVRGFVVERVK